MLNNFVSVYKVIKIIIKTLSDSVYSDVKSAVTHSIIM